jgi:cysteine desulfurase family protein (TIGR01976 family)
MTTLDLRHRFPGLSCGDWARFDGPAGTQPVDTAIEAMADLQRSGTIANSHGRFPMADACDALTAETRAACGRLLGADPAGVVLGPSATALLFRLSAAVARTLGPGDEVVCTTLDHDANVAPWLWAARDSGATVRFAHLDPATGRLPVEAVTAEVSERTRWVAVSGASNALGTVPDVAAVGAAARAVGARVVVDGVHRTPHLPVDVAALGCDVYVTSSYKWYGPHAAVMWVEPGLLDELPVSKVRPADDRGPGRMEHGTPSYEAFAGVIAAAAFLGAVGMEAVVAHERARFARLLDGLLASDGVRVWGPTDLVDRAPTVAFTLDGVEPGEVARHLAGHRVAVWAGHHYAVEVMRELGLAERGGTVRAGVSLYTTDDDVDRLLAAVASCPR